MQVDPRGHFEVTVKRARGETANVVFRFCQNQAAVRNECTFKEEGTPCTLPGSKASVNYCIKERCTAALDTMGNPTLCGKTLSLQTHDDEAVNTASHFTGQWSLTAKKCNDHVVYAHYSGVYELRVNVARSAYNYRPVRLGFVPV